MLDILYQKVITNVEETSTGCLEFKGALSAGYASIRREGKTYQGHAIVAEKTLGPRPLGMVVMHICSNRKCVNPTHLKYGTQKENLLQARLEGTLPFSGLTGVTYEKKRNRWIARYPIAKGKYSMLYQGNDFLEACCARKSWEARNEA